MILHSAIPVVEEGTIQIFISAIASTRNDDKAGTMSNSSPNSFLHRTPNLLC